MGLLHGPTPALLVPNDARAVVYLSGLARDPGSRQAPSSEKYQVARANAPPSTRRGLRDRPGPGGALGLRPRASPGWLGGSPD